MAAGLKIDKTLFQAVPLTYLSKLEKDVVLKASEVVCFAEGDVIIEQGQLIDECVWILQEGRVDIFDKEGSKAWVGTLDRGRVFGDSSAILQCPSPFKAVAQGDVECIRVPIATYRNLIHSSKALAFATARTIQEALDLFKAVRKFTLHVEQAFATGSLDFPELVWLYKCMEPALHPHALDDDIIDTGAWVYAVRRLPPIVTQTFFFSIITNRAPRYHDVSSMHGTMVSAVARRRFFFELQPGKAVCIMRDRYTDPLDFLTCMACHTVEAAKVRRRAGPMADDIAKALEPGIENVSVDDQVAVLCKVFSEDEALGLVSIWGKEALQRVWEIIYHHENYSFSIDKSTSISREMPSESWISALHVAVCELMGGEPHSVSIVSSNMHGVLNLLSPWVHQNAAAIEEWARAAHPGVYEIDFSNETDRLYYVTYKYLKEFPEKAAEREAVEREYGIETIHCNALTGIGVNLINLGRLSGPDRDPLLRDLPPPQAGTTGFLLINIDYAFGKQAEEILGNLIAVYGRKITSINVLGKAGALPGRRGDILLPSHFIRGTDLELRAVDNHDISAQRLHELSGRDVHVGTLLTVQGTYLQTAPMLHYYQELWKCVGLEMEGMWYYKQIERTRLCGLLRPDTKTRFLYYVSDLPLSSETNLSTSLSPWEGIPPLMAVTRAIVEQIYQPVRPPTLQRASSLIDISVLPCPSELQTPQVVGKAAASSNSEDDFADAVKNYLSDGEESR